MSDFYEPSTVSLPEAARMLGVSKSTAYDTAKATGELTPGVPVIKVGSRYVISMAHLRQTLGGSQPPPPPPPASGNGAYADLLDDIAAALATYAKRLRSDGPR